MSQTIRSRAHRSAGFTLVELVAACALAGALMGIAVPFVAGTRERMRTAAAARYVAGRLQLARMEALKRSAHVAFRVSDATGEYVYASFVDGNGNGVRTAEIASGVDPALTSSGRLGDEFPGVRFGCVDGVPSIDGGEAITGSDPVRVGTSGLVSFSAIGGATSGTLYVRGPGPWQFAVRITGATGRVRVLEFEAASRQWVSR